MTRVESYASRITAEQLLEASDVALLVIDRDGRVCLANALAVARRRACRGGGGADRAPATVAWGDGYGDARVHWLQKPYTGLDLAEVVATWVRS